MTNSINFPNPMTSPTLHQQEAGGKGGTETVVAIKTPGKTFELPIDTVSNFQSALLDGMLECARPDADGVVRLPLLDVDTTVFKRTLVCMRTKIYSTTSAWAGDECSKQEFMRQLEFLSPEAWSQQVMQREAEAVEEDEREEPSTLGLHCFELWPT